MTSFLQGFLSGLRNLFSVGRGRPGGRPQATRGPRLVGGGGRGANCANSGPNHSFQVQGPRTGAWVVTCVPQGGQYLVSWRLGCTSFTAGEGAAYCRANGQEE